MSMRSSGSSVGVGASTNATPRMPISVEIVNTSELMPVRAITKPCTAPKARPQRVATSTQGTRPSSDSSTAMMPATAATEATERSSSPAIMVTATPSATRPSTAKPSSIA